MAFDAASAGIVEGKRLCGADGLSMSAEALRLGDINSETVDYQARSDYCFSGGTWLQAFFGLEETVVVVPCSSS